MNQSLLRIHNLNKSFQQTAVLNAIDLEVKSGEILFLLGASGCGKTTLLRIIAGFERADSGQIWLKNNLIAENNRHLPTQQRQLGYVVQEGVLFPHFNVYRNIAYGLGDGTGKQPQARERIEQVMALTGIQELANRFPHELSGGQQQRVALARALAPQPQLILLDEPFSALDEHLRQQIRHEMLAALRQSGSTAIFVTHDREEALRYADRIAIMQSGHILQIDTPQTLYWQPQTLAVGQFIGESIVLEAELSHCGRLAHCAMGTFPVHKNKHTHQTSGQILLRPEQFILSTPTMLSDPSITPLQAVVENISCCGLYTHLTLNLNQHLLSLEKQHIPALQIGESITLAFQGSACFFEKNRY